MERTKRLVKEQQDFIDIQKKSRIRPVITGKYQDKSDKQEVRISTYASYN
jgi:hypothetical protein